MKDRYRRILKSEPDLMNAIEGIEISDEFEKVMTEAAAPVLIMYTKWIIRRSEELGIKRLYFLARDGYVMYHIAEKMREKGEHNIESSYFYCSRYALRLAAYKFRDDSAYDKLFLHAYRQSLYLLLKRAGMDEDQIQAVYDDIGIKEEKARENVGRKEFDEICETVKKSDVFQNIVKEISENAYTETVKYIRQEKLDRYEKVGIIDLGWTGSLQHTLRRLLDSEGIKTELVGFYMGMLEKPPERDGCQYNAWLFGERDSRIKAWFCQNVIESICSGPHGMTKGYRECGEKTEPIMAEAENDPGKVEKLRAISIEITEKEKGGSENIGREKTALKLLKALMFSPTKQECEALRNYRFCDDVGEGYHRELVEDGNREKFNRELLLHKIKDRDNTDGFYWYCGSVQAGDIKPKVLYRYAYLVTRYLISKRRRR